MINRTAEYWIRHLKLEQHPEGGYYTRVYSSDLQIKQNTLPKNFYDDRPICTHIYYLLTQKEFSAFHRIQSDELWHFYDGDGLKIYEIAKDASLIEHKLGLDLESGQLPFCIIKAGNWFAADLMWNSKYSLVGCSVSPGFDFAEFEMAEKEKLITQYPEYKDLIRRFTK